MSFCARFDCKETIAVSHCCQCRENLCASHTQKHSSYFGEAHKVVPLSENPSQRSMDELGEDGDNGPKEWDPSMKGCSMCENVICDCVRPPIDGPQRAPGPVSAPVRIEVGMAMIFVLLLLLLGGYLPELKGLVFSSAHHGGAAYTRWGATVCPRDSKIIYKGQMTGPDRTAHGGGVNYQCLPDDPEYESASSFTAHHSDLVSVVYTIHDKMPSQGHRVPCAVCEATRRITQVMIPAKSRCPSSDWTLDYHGHLVSCPTQHDDGRPVGHNHHRTEYVCLDSNAESLGPKVEDPYNNYIHLYAVKTRCSGSGALPNCPPYQGSVNSPLVCVVCSR